MACGCAPQYSQLWVPLSAEIEYVVVARPDIERAWAELVAEPTSA
jgi:hypothetical protein